MKSIFKSILFSGLAFCTMVQTSLAQEHSDTNADKLELGVSLNHDSFFGLNPAMEGAYHFNEKNALSFYGIIWGAGTGSAWGNWTEFGIGYKYTAGNFSIKPQVGITLGSLLSSGGQGRGVVGDGIVPNLFIDYNNQKFVGQIYTGYYATLRNTTTAGQSTNQYLHYWAFGGYKPTSWFTVGAHYEHLALTGGNINGGGNVDFVPGYNWIGPYVQFSKGHSSLRFAAGPNIADKAKRFSAHDFYKISFNIAL